ncbi:MAG: MBL fold metallo-hydrolase [Erysipelotrichaceae bacterium]|nr:MBL fold metallo-hydrolase [Erysipelotrichaceae bacterium]
MKFHVLASGSKGNCAVITSGESTLIIDCGSTQRYLKQRFREIGLDWLQADALLITHEHVDHIRQLAMFTQLHIYAPCLLPGEDVRVVEPYEPFKIGCFTILPIPLSHDCDDTVGYIIHDGRETLAYVTDTGYLSHSNEELIRDADYYIFESNYDLVMLMTSSRPAYLKARINSDYGHMENGDSAAVLADVIGPRTREIVLAHLSQECNKPELALRSLTNKLTERGVDFSGIRIHAAEQFGLYSGGNDQ